MAVPILTPKSNSDKILNPLVSQIKDMQKLIAQQQKDAKDVAKILKGNTSDKQSFLDKQSKKRGEELNKIRKNVNTEFEKLLSDRRNFSTTEGKFRLQQLSLIKKQFAHNDEVIRLEKEGLEQDKKFREEEKKYIEDRNRLLQFNSDEAKQNRRAKARRTAKDNITDNIFAKLTKPLGFLEKLGGFSFLQNRQQKREGKREVAVLDRKRKEERIAKAMEDRQALTSASIPEETRFKNAKRIKGQIVDDKKTGRPPKVNLTPKRGAILKHFPQFVYLADIVSEKGKQEKKDRSGKKAGFGFNLASFAKLGGILAGVAGVFLTVKDVLSGAKKFGAEGGGTGKASTSNIIASGIAGSKDGDVGGQALKFGLLGAGIGTFFGPVGTLVGGAIGGVVGGIIGGIGQKKVAKAIQFVFGQNLNDLAVEQNILQTQIQNTTEQEAFKLGLTKEQRLNELKAELKTSQKKSFDLLRKGGRTGFLGGLFTSQLEELEKGIPALQKSLKEMSDKQFKKQFGKTKAEATKQLNIDIQTRNQILKDELEKQKAISGIFGGGVDKLLQSRVELNKLQQDLKDEADPTKQIDIKAQIVEKKKQVGLQKLQQVQKKAKAQTGRFGTGRLGVVRADIIGGVSATEFATTNLRGQIAVELQKMNQLKEQANRKDVPPEQTIDAKENLKAVRAKIDILLSKAQKNRVGTTDLLADAGFTINKPVEDAIIRGREVIPMSIKDNVILTQADNIVDLDDGSTFGGSQTGSSEVLMELKGIKEVMIDLYALEKFNIKTKRDSLEGLGDKLGSNSAPVIPALPALSKTEQAFKAIGF